MGAPVRRAALGCVGRHRARRRRDRAARHREAAGGRGGAGRARRADPDADRLAGLHIPEDQVILNLYRTLTMLIRIIRSP